jgi:Carboxypeptidase regulatory-like domain
VRKFVSPGADRKPDQAEMGVQCSPFRSQKGNFGLNVFPTQPGRKGAMNSKRVFLAVLALAISFSTTKVGAQSVTDGSISGAVTDPSNALIPKAQVTLKDNSKGTTQETKTNASGLYEFALLAPSSYTVTVSAAGFQVVNRTANVVLGPSTVLNIQNLSVTYDPLLRQIKPNVREMSVFSGRTEKTPRHKGFEGWKGKQNLLHS